MSIKAQPVNSDIADGVVGPEFKPLTAEEARQWRKSNPPVWPWWVVIWQLVVGGSFALSAGLVRGGDALWSAGYGALCVVMPAALMVHGLRRQRLVSDSGAAMLGFVVWESVKIVVTVAMLVLAPKLVHRLNWLALVAGFVVTMKVYWVAAWLHSSRQNRDVSN